jgi:hypothetical protein
MEKEAKKRNKENYRLATRYVHLIKSAGVVFLMVIRGHSLRLNDVLAGAPRRFRLLGVVLSLSHHPPCRPTRTAHRDLAQLLAPFRLIIANVRPGRESLDKTTIAIHRVCASPRNIGSHHWHQLVGTLLGIP